MPRTLAVLFIPIPLFDLLVLWLLKVRLAGLIGWIFGYFWHRFGVSLSWY